MATIVIVDDNTDSVQLLERLLKFEGHVLLRMSAQNLVTSLKNMKPDLLLLDVMMPEIGGIDLLAMVKREPALEYLPVVMLSGVLDMKVQADALKYGAVDFISKGLDWERVLVRIGPYLKKN